MSSFIPARLAISNDVKFAKDIIITTGGGVCFGDRAMAGHCTRIYSGHKTILKVGNFFFMPNMNANLFALQKKCG